MRIHINKVAEYSHRSVERLYDEQKSNFCYMKLTPLQQSTAPCFQFLSPSFELQASSNDSRLMGKLPYHLRMSLGVLALLIFATKTKHFSSLFSTIHGSSLPRQEEKMPSMGVNDEERREERELEMC